MNTKHCKKCKKSHDGSFGGGIFCSRSCANSRKQTKEMNQSRRDKLQKPPIKYSCLCCNKEFYRKRKLKLGLCSPRCVSVYNGKLNKELGRLGNCGGYREGSGRSKSGYFNNFYCSSTYELAYYIWNIEHDVDIERCKESFNYTHKGNIHRYYPDFVVDGVIIETKGYHTDIVDIKTKAVESQGRKIKVLYEKDLTHMIDYVKDKYRVTCLEELYQEYEPRVAKCKICGQEFPTKRRSTGKICSRKCSGILVSKKLWKTKD